MNVKVFKTKERLKGWAKKTTGVVLVSISLVNSIQSVDFQFPTPKVLSQIMDDMPSQFPEGQYIVNYHNSDELDIDDLDYSKMAVAIAFEAQLANSSIRIGALRALIDNLVDYTYCCVIDKTDSAYVTARFWVLEPTDPAEVESLNEILEKYSMFYAFNDGTGHLSLSNARIGKGNANYVFEN